MGKIKFKARPTFGAAKNLPHPMYKGGPLQDAVERRLAEIESKSPEYRKLIDKITNGADVFINLYPAGAEESFIANKKNRTVTAPPAKLGGGSDDEFKEFVESIIFEVTNAAHSTRYLELDSTFGTTTRLTGDSGYGRKKAYIEAESSMTVVGVLRDLASDGYKPSPWGEKQLGTVGGKSLEDFRVVFAESPHSSTEPRKTHEMYSEAMMAGISRDMVKVQSIATMKKSGRTIDFDKLRASLTPEIKGKLERSSNEALWYWCCVELAKDPGDAAKGVDGTWSVTWNSGVASDWEVSPETREQLAKDWKEGGGVDLGELLRDARNETPKAFQ